jgi:hypothetical protein
MGGGKVGSNVQQSSGNVINGAGDTVNSGISNGNTAGINGQRTESNVHLTADMQQGIDALQAQQSEHSTMQMALALCLSDITFARECMKSIAQTAQGL